MNRCEVWSLAEQMANRIRRNGYDRSREIEIIILPFFSMKRLILTRVVESERERERKRKRESKRMIFSPRSIT